MLLILVLLNLRLLRRWQCDWAVQLAWDRGVVEWCDQSGLMELEIGIGNLAGWHWFEYWRMALESSAMATVVVRPIRIFLVHDIRLFRRCVRGGHFDCDGGQENWKLGDDAKSN